MEDDHYFCATHEVYGYGTVCWCWEAPARECLLVPGRRWWTSSGAHHARMEEIAAGLVLPDPPPVAPGGEPGLPEVRDLWL